VSLLEFHVYATFGSMRKTSELIWQDAQHQMLFEILDDLREPSSGADVVHRLKQYTETHFALEEQYMRLLDFPGIDAHTKAHDQFRAELDELVEELPEAEFLDLVSTFLTEWLTRHVFGIDTELEAFILQSSAK
jgi:hemerythrin